MLANYIHRRSAKLQNITPRSCRAGTHVPKSHLVSEFDRFYLFIYLERGRQIPALQETAAGLPSVPTTAAPCRPAMESCDSACEGIEDSDTGFMVMATTFVMLQTPALGLCQAGLIRRKNALSMLMQVELPASILRDSAAFHLYQSIGGRVVLCVLPLRGPWRRRQKGRH